MESALIQHIRNFITLRDDQVLRIKETITLHTLNKKEYLFQEGQICKALYFVEKGCLRMYFINHKATEQITQFAIEGWWIADYFSFMDNKPSVYYLQAIEKSTVASIDLKHFEKLLQEVPPLERYFRIILQRALAASQLRSKYLYEMSKEEFYQHFNTNFPEFVQRVPQYMLASYLGLSPEYVSELRKKSK